VPEIFDALSRGLDGSMIAYNPFYMANLAMILQYRTNLDGGYMIELPSEQEMITTIAIAVGIMVVVYLLALFAQNARKIDNRGNEMII
jgi:hypothetical protein